jgi:hypothetical protein
LKYSIANQRWPRAIFLLAFLYPPQAVQACTCMAFPENLEKAVAMAYGHADAVFLGDIMTMRTRFLGMLTQREVKFSVRDRWKGSLPETVLVRTNIGEIACGYNFKKRNSYLVFAYWDQRLQHFTTSFCDLNRTEDQAKGAIGVLDRLTKRAGGTEKSRDQPEG